MKTGRLMAARGFTLLELMVTCAIVAIIAAVAYPSYTTAMQKGHRSEARAALMEIVQFMEQQATRSNRYDQDENGNPTVLPYTNVPRDQPTSPTYTVTLTGLSAGSYTLNAVPVVGGAMASDACATLTINSLGTKSESGTAPISQCW